MKDWLDSNDVLGYIDDNFVNKDMVENQDKVDEFMKDLERDKVFRDENFLKSLATRKFLPRGYPHWAKQIVSFDIRTPIAAQGSIASSGTKLAWNVAPCLDKNYFDNLE